jgi:hypothetical protein
MKTALGTDNTSIISEVESKFDVSDVKKIWRFKRQVFVLPLQRISSNCIGSKIIYLAKWYQQSRVWCVQYRFRKAAVAAQQLPSYC